MMAKSEEIHGMLYPFTSIVGQEKVKTILILNAIDPTIGGALISGPKGTGKSILVNAFSSLLPDVEYASECPFRCSTIDQINMCPSCRKKVSEGEIQANRESMKIIQVPLSVTEDMLLGSIDMEKAVTEGTKALEPGLLAEANQNILYIDEVNLLPDHITDSILDAASSGWNIVEREGVSVQHPSRFILVGTMNPEEGELRPQILDRFGIYAETTSIQDPETRALVIDRNERFRRNPIEFIESQSKDLETLRNNIQKSRQLVSKVDVPTELYPLVAATCSRLKVDGFRPDIIAIKTARALAAFQGRDHVMKEDIQEALEYTLGHRTRKSGLAPPPLMQEIRKAFRSSELSQKIKLGLNKSGLSNIILIPIEFFEKLRRLALTRLILKVASLGVMVLCIFYLLRWAWVTLSGGRTTPSFIVRFLLSVFLVFLLDRLLGKEQYPEEQQVPLGILNQDSMLEFSGRLKDNAPSLGAIGGGNPYRVRYFGKDTSELSFGPKIMKSLGSLQKRLGINRKKDTTRKSEGTSSGGRRTRVISRSTRGRYAWYQIPRGRPRDIAIVPTIKVAATKQVERGRERLTIIEKEDIREKVREYTAPYSIVLLVDMSLSMTESVVNIVQSIYDFHSEVYRRRDRVGLVVFKGSKAYTLQHPTRNLDLVVKKLKDVGASDFTPLPAGLFQAWKTLKQEKLRNRDSILHLYVISDGIANVPLVKPLSPLTRRRYSSETQADTFDVSRLLVKEGIKVHIVNTSHNPSEGTPVKDENERIKLKPTQFLRELARVSKGEYIGLQQPQTP
jgi:Mg-chelatase subunit ChlI/Mg-chelatase subunit ChlD